MSLLGSVFKIGASLIGGSSSKKSSKAAQAAQIAAINKGIGTLNDQFAASTQLSKPWTGGGAAAQDELLNLLGISTPVTNNVDWAAYVQGNPDALANWNVVKGTSSDTFGGDAAKFGQYHYTKDGSRRDLTPYTTTTGGEADAAGAIADLKNSPLYQALFSNGIDSAAAMASATGGLRGGNAQEAFARVGTDTLGKVYQDRVNTLGSISGQGLDAVTGLENLGASNAAAIASLFGKEGDTRAGGILQRSAINSNMLNTVASEAGKIADGGGLGKILKGLF